MANQRKRRKWRLRTDADGTLRDWAESSEELTAAAIRAQLPSTAGMSERDARGAASGGRSEDARTIGAASGVGSGNASKHRSGDSGKVTQTARKAELGALKALDVIAFNRQAETAFVELLTQLISNGGGEIALIDAIRECAWHLDISTETVKRYLLKHTAATAEFVSDGKVVRLRDA